jgi:hypothetical protein
MASKPRKIKFYTLEQTDHGTKEVGPAQIIREVINYVNALPVTERTYKINSKKLCYLASGTGPYNGIHSLIIKSAAIGYRPPVMDHDTLAERQNPKREREGDREKTHIVIRYTADDVFLVVESNGNGVGIKAIIRYLRAFTRRYKHSINERMDLSLNFSIIAKDDFLDEVRSMSRVVLGKVYVEKSVLGGNALRYSNRTQSVRHEIVMNIKAKKEDSILTTIEDIYNKIATAGSRITKIRVEGKTANNGNTVADTSFIEKLENIDADVNSFTGVINSASIMTQLRDIANTL